MAHRIRPLVHPVEFQHDGQLLLAERGESLATALLAHDRLVLGRSPKLHRPRGPFCLRGACDGCLARVNGEPNVMTCRVAVSGGERVETQNVLGSRKLDLLRVADFMFPRGMDHHRLFAGVRGVSEVVQGVARRVAGLGHLPDRAVPRLPARKRETDVLIVGGGAAGLSAAALLSGPRVLLVDDGLRLGGSLRLLDPPAADAAIRAAHAHGAELLPHTTAVGLFGTEGALPRALLDGPKGMSLVSFRAVIVASGAHDRVPRFANNDLPGVLSARAALELSRSGVILGRTLVLLGQGRFGRVFRAISTGHATIECFDEERIVRAVGRTRISGLWLDSGVGRRRISVDGMVADGAPAPAFELCVQAGGRVRFVGGRGYVPERDHQGRVARGVYAAGGVASFDDASSDDSAADGRRVGGAVLNDL